MLTSDSDQKPTPKAPSEGFFDLTFGFGGDTSGWSGTSGSCRSTPSFPGRALLLGRWRRRRWLRHVDLYDL